MNPVSATQALKYLLLRRIWGNGITAYGLREDNEFLLSEFASRVASQLRAKSYHEEAKGLQQVPELWRYFLPLEYYVMQVCNGGHHQFFMNSEGAFNELVGEGLSYFGWPIFESLFNGARSCYRAEVYEANHPETWEEFARGYDDSPLDAIDTKFYEVEPSLQDLLEGHIKTNLKDYQH